MKFLLGVYSFFLCFLFVRAQCPLVEAPLHGFLSVDDPSLIVGTKVSVSCELGFNITGTNPITCTASNVWNNPVPYCEYSDIINVDALRQMSLTGAEEQDWWIDYPRYESGRVEITVAAVIVTLVFGLVSMFGAYGCGVFLINRRQRIMYRRAHPRKALQAEVYGETPWKDEPEQAKSDIDWANQKTDWGKKEPALFYDDGETVPIAFRMRKGRGWQMVE